MDDDKSSGGSKGTSGLWWLAVVAAGALLVHEVPWQGSRPLSTDPKPYPYPSRQDIDARLWQDPLSAIARGREDRRKQDAAAGGASVERVAAREAEDHGFASLARSIGERGARVGKPVAVLAVMVQGGSYAEAAEARRRARYAVLAGLKQNRYAPRDAAHLGYVVPPPADDQVRLPEFIGYEWFDSEAGGPPVLALWLDEYVFGTRTLERIHRLRDALKPAATPGAEPSFVVVGPTYSSTLQDMAARDDDPSWIVGAPAFYAYGASSDAAHILHGGRLDIDPSDPRHLEGAFARHGLRVLRTVGDDASLVQALAQELQLRGTDHDGCGESLQGHVVLIAEWDTLYGRTLPELMTKALRGADPCAGPTALRIHRFSYLRGLDGQLPTLESAAQDTARADADASADASHATDRRALQRQVERPEGQGQLDYLRRMSQDLLNLEGTWRRLGEGPIQAIGVLGSDVFDKLLVLQALRPQFPNAIFFTTDLDARMLHPQEQDWARNLVVASSFGLSLRPDLQQDLPPFRDTYQTSAYLSTLIALHDVLRHPDPSALSAALGRWLGHPRIFEIGRTQAFDFSFPRNAADRKAVPSTVPCAFEALDACGWVHPDPSPMVPVSKSALFYKKAALVVAGSRSWSRR